MGFADDFNDLLGDSANMRLEMFGTNNAGTPQLGRMFDEVDLTKTFTCYMSPDRNGETSFELGFKESHDCVVRVAKTEANFIMTAGKKIILLAANPDGTDLVVNMKTPAGASALNSEWIVGCKNIF